MKKGKKEIGFSLKGIKTEQFAVIEENFDDGNEVSVAASLQIKQNQQQQQLGIFVTFKFIQNQRNFIKIELSCHFKIESESWNRFIHKEDTKLIVPKDFLIHIAMITIGTARGVLHTKTEGTPFSKFIIPTINVVDMINEDASFELDIEE